MTIDVEHMRDLTMGRQLRPETQHGEQLVRVVVLHDFPHGLDGHLVLIAAPRVDVVQGSGLPRVAVGPREVDGDGAGELGAAADVVQEGVALDGSDVSQVDLA